MAYTSFGGKYSRTITANSNLSATDAWLNASTQGNVDVPVNAIEDAVTYYPDVEITTTAASILTVNADMDVENIKFDGAGKLTIASDGEHNIHIYGSLTANGPISVKYGETNLSAVPVTIGESGSVEFDFSASDFSSVNVPTDYPVTGNTVHPPFLASRLICLLVLVVLSPSVLAQKMLSMPLQQTARLSSSTSAVVRSASLPAVSIS